jgi:4a-hydroxytetrahydrobiopterin dehydratase
MQLTPLTSASRRLTQDAAGPFLQALPGWTLTGYPSTDPDALRLTRDYHTPDFLQAMELATRISQLAEQHNHHPELLVRWGVLQVRWWTHVLHGVHENDFLMAAATDAVIAGRSV